MALDGFILHSLLKNIALQCPFKVNKIQQVGEHHFLFHAYAVQRFNINLVLDAQTARITLTHQSLPQTHQSTFLTSLKKYCEGATCTHIIQDGLDRHFKMIFDTTNDVFEKIKVTLYVELMGQYTNAILVNESMQIIDAHTKIYPDKNSTRYIMMHSAFQPIKSQDKLSVSDPRINEKTDSWMEIEGCSPLLAKELEYRFHLNEKISDILNLCLDSQTLYISESDPKIFHVIPLLHTQSLFQEGEIHKMMGQMYALKEHQKNIKVLTQDISKVITKELKKQRSKALKLYDDLISTSKSQDFKTWADYCMSYAYLVKKGDVLLEVPSFDDENINVSIPLQPHLSGIENANAYYKKASKMNQSIVHIHEQMSLTQTMITYLESCESALEFASIDEALQIKDELVAQKLMRSKTAPVSKKKQGFKILHYVEDDFSIYVGKNNIQNDYLTFNFAHKHDFWFHVKDAPSSHVILRTQKGLNEHMIRTAANICANYSKYSKSSSVEVMYTSISNIKKIPRAPLGLVSVKQYTTIFIDPDQGILTSLKY
jgi:predicted ribosome quality control (RQC) complex YloA/Tae2 family protein